MTVIFALTWQLVRSEYETCNQSHTAVGLSQRLGEKFFLPTGFVKQEVSVSHEIPCGQGKLSQNMHKQIRYSSGVSSTAVSVT